MASVSLPFFWPYLYFTENPLPKPQPSSLIIYSTKSSIESCSPPRFFGWNEMSKKNSPKEHQERKRKKKKKKQDRKTSSTGFEPPTDESEIVKLSTAPRGINRVLTVEELIFFVTWFFFEVVLALGAHPAPGITVLFHGLSSSCRHVRLSKFLFVSCLYVSIFLMLK